MENNIVFNNILPNALECLWEINQTYNANATSANKLTKNIMQMQHQQIN
jgi:hypothetical protein